MKKTDWLWAVGFVAAAIAGVAFYLHSRGDLDDLVAAVQPIEPPPPAPPAPAPEPAQAEPTGPQNPVPAAAEAPTESLPPLADSDAAVRSALETVIKPSELDAYLVPRYIVRRFVATVDSLPKESLPSQLRPIRPLGGSLAVSRTQESGGERVWLAPAENSPRYDPLISLLERTDLAALTQIYFRHYPLFQKAYVELGSRRYFNDRFIEVIDHLLAAPAVSGSIELVRVRSTWRFADPQLERLSAGHKAMIRLGPDHARTVRARLRELRTLLAAKES